MKRVPNFINYYEIRTPDHKLGDLIGKKVAGYKIVSPQGGSERYQHLEILFTDGSTLEVDSQGPYEYLDVEVELRRDHENTDSV